MMFLKGDQVYQFEINVAYDKEGNVTSYGKVSQGYPKMITTVFPRMAKNNIDSAFTTYCENFLLFFQDGFYWELNRNKPHQKIVNGPYPVSNIFPGLCM